MDQVLAPRPATLATSPEAMKVLDRMRGAWRGSVNQPSKGLIFDQRMSVEAGRVKLYEKSVGGSLTCEYEMFFTSVSGPVLTGTAYLDSAVREAYRMCSPDMGVSMNVAKSRSGEVFLEFTALDGSKATGTLRKGT
jgi:hypothetical protein